MDQRMFKIHNKEDFDRITRGIKVAQCMQLRSSSVSETEKVLNQLEELVVSDSLSCSFCNTIFEDKIQQRLHYKLDWHRYNLKQRLNGLKSISEDNFNLLADKGDVSSLSGSEVCSDNEDDTDNLEIGGSPSLCTKTNELINKDENSSLTKSKKLEKKGKSAELVSDSSDTECNEEISKEKKIQELLVIASRHSKVFFENDDGSIFSIYRCLLHNKKEIPEMDNEMIAQALNSGKRTTWTIIMVGGGHFAAAVFQDGDPIVHKTFHSYTVRARQGSTQTSRDSRTSGNHPKSAGANLRRYNEASLTQHVQEILESWKNYINDSSLILYRAVGPHNRTILFGGKNPCLDKNDTRLRPLPFPTRRATYNEVKRVYDILSTMEIYGSAADFTDSFPISPRQPLRKKIPKSDLLIEVPEKEINSSSNFNAISNINSSQNIGKCKTLVQTSPDRQHRSSRANIDRAKPRKSPCRPLPDIVVKLALTPSESETENDCSTIGVDMPLLEHNMEIDFREHLLAFQNTVPRYMKNKKARKQKKKMRKDKTDVNEVLYNAKDQLWTACKSGDNELLSSTIDILLTEVKKSEAMLEDERKVENVMHTQAFLSMESVIKLLNDANEDGNTMLHIAAVGGHLKLIWMLLEIGSDPCNKNKKLETPYVAAKDKETRNIFRRFMGANPTKFNYSKSQIPGPLTDEIEQEEMEKKKQQRKAKRDKEKIKKREFELKKQEEEAKQRFLNLSDEEKRALVAENIPKENGMISRCFQCAMDITNQVPFSYNSNYFCSMPCLKEHRLHNKHIL